MQPSTVLSVAGKHNLASTATPRACKEGTLQAVRFPNPGSCHATPLRRCRVPAQAACRHARRQCAGRSHAGHLLDRLGRVLLYDVLSGLNLLGHAGGVVVHDEPLPVDLQTGTWRKVLVSVCRAAPAHRWWRMAAGRQAGRGYLMGADTQSLRQACDVVIH